MEKGQLFSDSCFHFGFYFNFIFNSQYCSEFTNTFTVADSYSAVPTLRQCDINNSCPIAIISFLSRADVKLRTWSTPNHHPIMHYACSVNGSILG